MSTEKDKLLGSICSCTVEAVTKLLRLCRCNNDLNSKNAKPESVSSPVFSIEQSLQESPIAPMSSLAVSEPSFLLSESIVIGYGAEPFAQDDTPLEDTKEIFTMMQSNEGMCSSCTSDLRPYNLNATHFHALISSITPSEYEPTNMEGSRSSEYTEESFMDTETEDKNKKKYPITPYPKLYIELTGDLSSPSVFKKLSKLPKSVITMRRGLGEFEKKKNSCS